MRTRNIAITTFAVLGFAIAAYASPIFGTWKGELNGHAITVTVTSTSGHVTATMTADGRDVAVTNAAFPHGGPPMALHFQAANQTGNMKLVSTGSGDLNFELATSDGQESLLRVSDQGKTVATVKMTKADSPK